MTQHGMRRWAFKETFVKQSEAWGPQASKAWAGELEVWPEAYSIF